jgi:drug/metabolite transporter (DMT)-like permease
MREIAARGQIRRVRNDKMNNLHSKDSFHERAVVSESGHRAAILQALLVTFLWSTSWVLIKIGLQDIPALTFAGLRYFLAFLCLLPFVLRSGQLSTLRGLSLAGWGRLVLLGVLLIAITQGAQYVGLSYLPSVTVSLLFNLTILLAVYLGMILLAERPGILQWMGLLACLIGVLIYFYPVSLPSGQVFGMAIVLVGVITNALSSVLGRAINRAKDLHPLAVTCVSIGVGGALLLLSGVLVQGFPNLELRHWLIIAWLAVVNTAFAFTMWNQTLRTLTVIESNIINNTMLIQIAILAWLFLGETLTPREVIGMLLVAVGAVIVQLRRGLKA